MEKAETGKKEGGEKKDPKAVAIKAAEKTVTNAEIEASDPSAPKGESKFVKFLNNKYVRRVGAIGKVTTVWVLTPIYRMVESLAKFAKEVMIKNGNVGFGKGFEIGQDIFEEKKDKK